MEQSTPFHFLPEAFRAALLIVAAFEFRGDAVDQSEEVETMKGLGPVPLLIVDALLSIPVHALKRRSVGVREQCCKYF